MAWLDGLSRRLARVERLAAAAEDVREGGPTLTRRQGLKLAAGAAAAGGLVASGAEGATCVRVDQSCLRTAEADFTAAVRACNEAGRAVGLWEELRCRVRAQRDLARSRAGCRVADDARCRPGEHCDPGSGQCRSGAGAGRDAAQQPGSPSGGGGQPGAPSGVCAGDPPTVDSLGAARDAILAGATTASLSPAGCLGLQVTREGNAQVFSVSAAGQLASEITDNGDGTGAFRRDEDQDGFLEVRATLERPGGVPRATIEKLSPTTGQPVQRIVRQRSGSNVQVTREDDTGNGMTLVQRYTTTVGQAWSAPETRGGVPSLTTFNCSAEDRQKILPDLMAAIDQGLDCLIAKGFYWPVTAIINKLLNDGLDLQCEESDTAPPALMFEWDTWPVGDAQLIVNTKKFYEQTANTRAAILFHELLHGPFGDHADEYNSHPRAGDLDPTRACETMCFNKPLATKCHCATCLGVNCQDPKCAEFKACPPRKGFRCPCPSRYRLYEQESTCLAECPSGLACFGYSTCDKIDDQKCS